MIFNKKIDLIDFSKKFFPISKKELFLIKMLLIFVDKENLISLSPIVSISDLTQQYIIEISTSKSKTRIRLNPNTDPEKTNQIKHSMVLPAKQITDNYNEIKIPKTNLSKFLGVKI